MEFLANERILFETALSHHDDLNAHKKYRAVSSAIRKESNITVNFQARKKKQRHVNSFYQFHGEIIMIHRLCSTQFQVELLSIINCVKTLLAFHLKKYQ